MPPRPAPAALPPPFAAESPSLAPAGQTHQATLPYGVDPVPSPPGLGPHGLQRPAAMAAAGSSLAAARPGGYRDGAEDATTVPSAAIATTAVTAWWLWSGPVIAGTVSVLPFSWYGGGWPPLPPRGLGRRALFRPARRRDIAGRVAGRSSARWRTPGPAAGRRSPAGVPGSRARVARPAPRRRA